VKNKRGRHTRSIEVSGRRYLQMQRGGATWGKNQSEGSKKEGMGVRII